MNENQVLAVIEELVEELIMFDSKEKFKSLETSYKILVTSASLVKHILVQISEQPLDQYEFRKEIYTHLELLAHQTLDLEEFLGE